MFAGIGAADLAVEHALGATPSWQLDVVGAAVRRRHWPDALQVEADVRGVDPAALPLVDVLVAGFPCQDLSVAGSRAGLDGARSGLYSEVIRFTAALRPGRVVLENVPGLLPYMSRLVTDFGALGYGLTWTTCRAVDAGHPHLRRRLFVLATLGEVGRGLVAAPARSERDGRTWPTPMGSDAASSGSRSRPGSKAHPGTSLTDAVRADRAVAGERTCWPTPATRDYRVGSGLDRAGTPPLSEVAAPTGGRGRRLNPAWVEALMGLPIGWTSPTGPALAYDPGAPAVRGRYPADWDRTQVWPGYDWEPPRTLPDGPPVRGRAERLRAVGNAWCPQQGALALRALVAA